MTSEVVTLSGIVTVLKIVVGDGVGVGIVDTSVTVEIIAGTVETTVLTMAVASGCPSGASVINEVVTLSGIVTVLKIVVGDELGFKFVDMSVMVETLAGIADTIVLTIGVCVTVLVTGIILVIAVVIVLVRVIVLVNVSGTVIEDVPTDTTVLVTGHVVVVMVVVIVVVLVTVEGVIMTIGVVVFTSVFVIFGKMGGGTIILVTGGAGAVPEEIETGGGTMIGVVFGGRGAVPGEEVFGGGGAVPLTVLLVPDPKPEEGGAGTL